MRTRKTAKPRCHPLSHSQPCRHPSFFAAALKAIISPLYHSSSSSYPLFVYSVSRHSSSDCPLLCHQHFWRLLLSTVIIAYLHSPIDVIFIPGYQI
ncbi:hypothetical protein BJX64DRAFT_187795 [Aspergillus heterothallicus]